jgi:hypothetical protein
MRNAQHAARHTRSSSLLDSATQISERDEVVADTVSMKRVGSCISLHRSLSKTAPRFCLGAVLLALTGCWPFHRGLTPQEQYYLAVSRGDAITAAQVWTHMSPKDRAKLIRGEGVGTKVQQQLIRQQMLRQQMINLGSGTQGNPAAPQGATPYQNPPARAAAQAH